MATALISILLTALLGIWAKRATDKNEERRQWRKRVLRELQFTHGKLIDMDQHFLRGRAREADKLGNEILDRHDELAHVLGEAGAYGSEREIQIINEFTVTLNQLGDAIAELKNVGVVAPKAKATKAAIRRFDELVGYFERSLR